MTWMAGKLDWWGPLYGPQFLFQATAKILTLLWGLERKRMRSSIYQGLTTYITLRGPPRRWETEALDTLPYSWKRAAVEFDLEFVCITIPSSHLPVLPYLVHMWLTVITTFFFPGILQWPLFVQLKETFMTSFLTVLGADSRTFKEWHRVTFSRSFPVNDLCKDHIP